jgi:hypothetical protein
MNQRRYARTLDLSLCLPVTLVVAALASNAGCGTTNAASSSSASSSASGASAQAEIDASTAGTDAAPSPEASAFAPNSPYVYVAKVKNILVGLPPTDSEVLSVVNATDPVTQLQTLIQGWMTLADPTAPAGTTYYEEKMRVFFALATQQTQVGVTAFSDQVYPGQIDVNASTTSRLVENATESFARTMVDEVVDGTQPLTQVATTTTFMMTTALMEAYAFLDTWQVNDSGSVVDHFAKAHPGQKLTVGSAAVAPGDSVDPTSPNFMTWTDPDVAAGGAYGAVANQGAGCATDPITYPATGLGLHYLLYGAILGHSVTSPLADAGADAGANGGADAGAEGGADAGAEGGADAGADAAGTASSAVPGTAKCLQFGGTANAPQVGNATGGAHDFDDWRMVTVRQPMAGEATTVFYDLPTLRQSNTLVLNLPRVGFFTTPAFFANWQTNTSNTMRVTMNQTLIVALGAMFDGVDSTMPALGSDGGLPGLDSVHAGATTACYVCHRLLDPTRSLLSSTYSWNYHAQDTASLVAQPGEFAFQGVVASPQTVFDLATILSTHPLFASAWVQKLCEYANSQPCETQDPEFARIVKDFQSGGYSWKQLVTEILASPLTTGATTTQTTADEGETVAVSRRDHLCAALNFRLGFDDICALLPTTTPLSTTIAQIARGLPSDGYGRGAVAPVLPNTPTLFYRSGTENMCEAVAHLVIDVPAATQVATVSWSSATPGPAIADFVQIVMGLVPSDPRYGSALAILTSHDQAALAVPGTTPTEALQSTFIAACLAPSAISMGM